MVMITFGLLVRVMMTGTQPILPELPSQTNTVHKEFVWVLAPALQVWSLDYFNPSNTYDTDQCEKGYLEYQNDICCIICNKF